MSYCQQLTSGFGICLVDKIDDPFAPFRGWLKDEQNVEAQVTVQDNLKLLKDEAAWDKHIKVFETTLAQVSEGIRDDTRKKYLISFKSVSFDQHTFRNREVRFPCDTSFANSAFPIHSDFSKLVVNGSASFKNAKFQKDARFIGAEINGNLTLDFADITGGALFCSTTRKKHTEVSNPVRIKGNVSFNHLKLTGNLNLSDADICGQFNMQDAKIDGGVQFWKARLRDGVNLERTKIGGDFLFEHVNLQSDTAGEKPSKFDAMGMVVEGAIAVNAHFRGDMSVFRLLSNGSASFAGSKFDKVPDFTDAKFANPFELSKMDIPSPKMPNWKFWKFDLADNNEDEAKFRKLKVMAMEVHDHEREGRFLADEFIAKRNQYKPSFSYLYASWLYWLLSDFGQSFVRPLVGLICSFLIFLNFYLVAVLWGQLRYPNWDELYLTLQLSMRNILPFFGSLFRFSPRPKEHNSAFMNTYHDLVNKGLDADWLVAIGIIQNIIGAVLLFLFLLALRNKFRLK